MSSIDLNAVNKWTCHDRWGNLPKLGLECKMDFAYRVYVLLCKGPRGSVGNYFYVGIAWAKDTRDHLLKHFGGGATHFTDVNKPKDVLLIHPATNAAVERYVFNVSLSTLPTRPWVVWRARLRTVCAVSIRLSTRLMWIPATTLS